MQFHNKYFLLLLLLLLLIQFESLSQEVLLDTVFIEPDTTTKMVSIRIEINGTKLDTLNRVKLLGDAHADSEKSSMFISDWFYSDDYLDNEDNLYTFVFDSIPIHVEHFKRIEGKLRLFSPSKEKNSIVIVSGGIVNYNRNIIPSNPDSIKVIPINAIQLDKIKKRRKQFNSYVKRTISENQLNETLFLETLHRYFDDRSQYKLPKTIKDNIIFYIEYVDLRVVKITIEDHNTGRLSDMSKLNGPNSAIWEISNFRSKFSDVFAIEVILENKESLKDFDFDLLNVELK